MANRAGTLVFSAALFLLSTVNVSAGGGPVDFRVEPNTPLSPGEQYVVHATVYDDGPYPTYCKNCKITLKLQNPQADDLINQSSVVTDENGNIYAKVISYIPGKRVMSADVAKPDGTPMVANSQVVLNYTGGLTPSAVPVTASQLQIVTGVKITGETHFTGAKGPMRHVFVEWSPIDGDVRYFIHHREISLRGEDHGWATSSDAITAPHATIDVKADVDWDIRVEACPTGKTEGCTHSDVTYLPQPGLLPTIEKSQMPVGEVVEVDKKVSSLEAALQNSLQKQSSLEKRISDLLALIKRLIPFFN